MDITSVVGTLLGILAVFGGALLEGLHMSDIMQPTAAIIVFGGTFGAALVSYPPQDIRKAASMFPLIYQKVELDVRPVIEEIVRIATIARKEGVLAIEGQRESIVNPLFKKTIKYVIDGFEPNTVKEIIDTEIILALEEEETAGKVYEGAGGYSPTIGIIGAVLGLIHVMKSLDDPSKIGSGIAVAFVATVYGVGAANLLLIPWGTKLQRKAAQRAIQKEVVKIGVVGIQEGLNPHFLQEKLEVFVEEHLRADGEHK
ncbi:MAG: flagellar motor protein [Bdellovibrionales bacterium]|nr:flagellar motor protein [Bdellovibrionales bacterium]